MLSTDNDELSGRMDGQVNIGIEGATFTPVLTETDEGVELSWQNNKGLANPDPVNIKGPEGPRGDRGAAGPAGDDYVLTEADKQEIAEMAAELVEVPEHSGGNVDYIGVEPAEDDIPKVFLTGAEFSNMTIAKNEVKMGLEYISKTDKFNAAIKIKFQGNSSLSYPKKNFTIKMYTDDTYESKLKKSFKDWDHSGNKYVLKANYIDHAHARNIISANLWSEVVASRPDYDTLPEELRNSPRNGAIDGFPIKLYINGTYQGIYTWNIGKDDWMWGMDEDNTNHVLMCAETNDNGNKSSTPCNFRALWSGTDENHWTVEVGTNSTAVKTALNNLIQFVMDNDGDAFRNGIGQYLDIQSAIDYYIFMYDVCGLDGLAKNMLLATYDGKFWRCGAYDMDSTFGLFWNGSKFVAATYRCPEDYQETNSLLWERIEANFQPELKARQAELRKTVLSYANIVTHFERFMDVIGLDLYAEDLTIYTGIPSGSTNNIKQIRDFVRDRQAFVDAEFAAMTERVPCTGISLDKTTLTFMASGTQTITATATPSDTTDSVVWVSSAPDVASITVSGNVCTVQSVSNGNAVITVTCGEYSASCTVSVSGIGKKYNVTNTLTNCTNSNSATTVEEGASYSATITANSGYSLDSVTVTHNAEAVTVTNGTFTIDSVTGDIVIVASAVFSSSEEAQYSLASVAKTDTSGVTLEISNDNHVKITGGTSAVSHYKPNLLNTIAETEANVTNIIAQKAKFSIASGNVVKVVFVTSPNWNYTGNMSITAVKALATTGKDIFSKSGMASGTRYEQETTFTENTDVGTIASWWMSVATTSVIEFDLYVYVNDVLVIGKGGTQFVRYLDAPEWSDAPDKGCAANGVLSDSGDSYVYDNLEIPEWASVVYVYCVEGATFNYIRCCGMDESGNCVVSSSGNAKNIGSSNVASVNAKYVRGQAHPTTATDNNPANQIRFVCY